MVDMEEIKRELKEELKSFRKLFKNECENDNEDDFILKIEEFIDKIRESKRNRRWL